MGVDVGGGSILVMDMLLYILIGFVAMVGLVALIHLVLWKILRLHEWPR